MSIKQVVKCTPTIKLLCYCAEPEIATINVTSGYKHYAEGEKEKKEKKKRGEKKKRKKGRKNANFVSVFKKKERELLHSE